MVCYNTMLIKQSVVGKSRQSGGFICLIAMLIFGCFSITTACLLVRSDKKTEIEDTLTVTGDYDVIAYEAPIGFEDYLAKSEVIDEVGLYYELGSVTNAYETETFKAVALKDELSEEIYHLTCIRGSYPKSDNEIAIDVSVANTYGIAPYPGETMVLKSYDSSGEYLEEKEYVISGVFRLSFEEVVGGWYRAPLTSEDYSWYPMPAVFFSSSNIDSWKCTKETVFFRGNSAGERTLVNAVYNAISDAGQGCKGIEYNQRRSSGYAYYIGLDQNRFYGDSTENLGKAVSDGLFKKDFYSAILFPIISALVVITESVSLYMLSKNIITDRKEHYAILRCIGVSSKRIIANLLIEILGFGMLGADVGIALGYAAHLAMIKVFNSVLRLRMYDGIHVEKIIRQITPDPIVMALLVCGVALILSLIIPLYRLYKMYPAELLSTSDNMFVEKQKKHKQKTTRVKGGWIGLLNRRIDLHDNSTMLVMVIMLSSLLFGYVFFRAFSEQATRDVRGYMDMLEIDGNGYVTTRSPDLQNWGYIVTNRHDAGITPSLPELVENNSYVENSWSVIFNESTRMVFDEMPDENIKKLLGNRLLNYRPSEDPYIQDAVKAEGIIFEHTGYDPHVYMYELPTVGLTTKEMTALEVEVLAGQIDIDRIKSGEEVVLAVPQELQDLCLQCFPIGSSLSFDDIVLDEEEEALDFRTLNDSKWVVYENYINDWLYGYAAFGKRHGISTKVGAIVVLHDEKDIGEYLTSGNSWVYMRHSETNKDGLSTNDPQPTCGMSILCLPESFEKWGLPDRNYTSVKVELKDGCDIYEFDKTWYKALSGSIDVQTKSTFDYMDEITTGTNRVMTIFFVLMSVLVLLSMMSIITGLYTKTRSNSSRFQILRRIGFSVKQSSVLIYTQNMFYPIISTISAIIPVYVMQWVLETYKTKIMNGDYSAMSTQWSNRIPYAADLFSYNFIPALICCLLLGFLLIFIGTLPQIIFLRKMKMIETRED